MSFQDFGRSAPAAGRAAGGKSGVSAWIFQLNTAVAGFRRLADQLGTSKDSAALRSSLQQARSRIAQLTKETSEQLKTLADSNRYSTPERQAEEAKLARDFQAVLQDFQKVQRLASEREATFVPATSTVTVSSGAEGTLEELRGEDEHVPQWQQKRHEVISLENEVVFNDALIEERDQGMKDIGIQVEEVNEIYRDLAVLLDNQQSTIDDVSRQVESSAASAALAKSQIRKSYKGDRSRSQWCFWLAIIFVTVVVIILAFLIIH